MARFARRGILVFVLVFTASQVGSVVLCDRTSGKPGALAWIFNTIVTSAPVDTALAQSASDEFSWFEAAPGYAVGRFPLGKGTGVLRPEVLLLKVDPKRYRFRLLRASEFGAPLADVQSMVLQAKGLAGINAHFFDPEGKPLGLLIDSNKSYNRIHRGGSLLTGIFLIDQDHPTVVDRYQFGNLKPELALQSGPRLIQNGKVLDVAAADTASRRSGIAVTQSDEVILYATVLRFPGASLRQIQDMLVHPAIATREALNLDGGGSSQLFISKNAAIADDTFVSGGDSVPTCLLVTKRES